VNGRHLQGAAVIKGTVAIVLIVAAVLKIAGFREFAESVDASLLVPGYLVVPVCVLVLLLELSVGFALLHRRLWWRGAVVGTGLFTTFALYSAWRAVASIGAPCNCFGPLFRLSPWAMLAINMACIAALVVVVRLHAIGVWSDQIQIRTVGSPRRRCVK